MNDAERDQLARDLSGNGGVIRVAIYGPSLWEDWTTPPPRIEVRIAELDFYHQTVDVAGPLSFEDVWRIQRTIERYRIVFP